MSDRISVACPNCRSTLNVRAEYLGRDLQCRQCQHTFAPSPADAIDPTTLPDPSIAPPAGERVKVECPGCRRTLKIRPQYLGLSVTCNRCEHRFIAVPGSEDGATRGPAGRGEDSPREWEGLERKHLALESEIGLLAGRLGGVEAGLEELHSGKPGRDASLEGAVDELEQRRREYASLEASVSAIRAEFEGFRGTTGSAWEAERQAVAGEVVARFEGERDLARRQLEQVQLEVEGLRRQDIERADRWAEAEARMQALESRLGPLEEATRHGIERGSRLEERLRGLEDAGADRDATREESGRLRDQGDSLRQVVDGQAEEFRAGLAAFRAEHSSIRQAIDAHEERHAQAAAGLASHEVARLEGERGVADLREKLEAGYLVVRDEIEKLHELLQQVVDHQAERHGRLDRSFDRLDAIEAGWASLRDELESVRLEQAAPRKDALSRSEGAAPRAELGTRTSPPSPVAPASRDPRPDPAEAPSPPMATVAGYSGFASLFNLDQLAEDLVLDQLVRPDGRSRSEGPATLPATSPGGAGVPGPSSPTATPASSDDTADDRRLVEQFTTSMRRGQFAEAIAAARDLVARTAGQVADRPLEHALWLRNLGMGLMNGGNLLEAGKSLNRALQICQANMDSDQLPHAICLIDLTELYLLVGERRQSRAFCLRALAILEGMGLGPDNPITMKARACMARIGSNDPGYSAFKAISITT